MSRKLHYTIQSILSELQEIILSEDNLPDKIYECYVELEALSLDLDILILKTGMDSQELVDEIYDVYQDMLDLYFENIETQYLSIKDTNILDIPKPII